MEKENELKDILKIAYQKAYSFRNEFITPEHFLYAVLLNEKGKNIVTFCGVDYNNALDKVFEYINDMEKVPYNVGYEPTESEIFKNLYKVTVVRSQLLEREEITLSVMIKGLIYVGGMAAYILMSSGFQNEKIEEYINNEINGSETGQVLNKKERDYLFRFVTDLTERAKRGELDPVIGREEIIERTIRTLSRRLKNNPLHVGETGVGKTTIIEGIAQLISDGKTTDKLNNSKIFSLDMSAMLAGTKLRGEFEERIINVFKLIRKYDNPIVYIDEIHNVIGAGRVGLEESASDASAIIKQYLLDGKLKVIGSTTDDEFKKIFEKRTAFARRFQKIEVPEPSIEDCTKILSGIKYKYEQFHNVKYTDEALEAAVKLSAQYITDKRLPDKAIDVIDEAAAYLRTKNADKKSEITIDTDVIEMIVSQIAKVKVESVNLDETESLRNLETNIKKEVFGQDMAVEAVSEVVKTARAGINDKERPLASMLFVGPTGVGKTELAKALSNQLAVPLIRFDMSEYQEKYSISKLIGSAPGYVGYEEGGLLAEQIRKNPYCVLLLDEIEKADQGVYNLLLQIMDYGTMTDNTGRKINFRNVILIMTSNAGAADINKRVIGFEERTLKNDAIKNQLEKTFTPEFRNRLDDIIMFNSITPDIALDIVKKAVSKISDRLADKDIKVIISDGAGKWLAKKGYSEVYGAREINRIVESTVKKPIVDEILFGRLKYGGTVSIELKDDEIKFSFRKKRVK